MLFKKDFFSAAEKQLIKEAVQQAEEKTSGEIRVYVEAKNGEDVVLHATQVFHRLKMHETRERNGVLFYLAYGNHRFAIIGDEGIHQKVGNDFWDNVKKVMEEFFRKKKFIEGLQKGIGMAGDKLKQHFPYEKSDKNELSDDMIVR